MNIYLLQLVGKWISIFVVSIASFFGTITLKEQEIIIDNNNKNKNLNVVNEVVEYTTIKRYTNRLPLNTTKIVVKGENGIIYHNDSTQKVLKEMVPEVIEVGTGPAGEYVGRMTGYGPDCKGCSKVGNVACLTKDKKKFSLINDGIYYEDEEYGEVRILAAALSMFPCGTIIEVNHGYFEKFIGVVLDTGVAMRSALKNDQILMDLAFPSELDPSVGKATRNNVQYSVKRWGW
jgi:3D (Asp-Asp-Asp) domain-containing protein